MSDELPDWTVCQIGAREHYSIATSFARAGRLEALITDAWAPPGKVLARLSGVAGKTGKGFRDRFHPELSNETVLTPSLATFSWDVIDRVLKRRASSWDAIHAANQNLGQAFAELLKTHSKKQPRRSRAVFAYSYGALEVLQEARRQGAIAILGQIDPGPGESRLVEEIAGRHGLPSNGDTVASEGYWARWHEECAIADKIVVNSAWSKELLVNEGVSDSKIAVIPLALPHPIDQTKAHSKAGLENPLSILFLGQVCVRKGVVELIQAVNLLADENFSLTLVGSVEDRLKGIVAAQNSEKVSVVGHVPRSEVSTYFQNADIFVFPTHSDGFGLTQLEAMAHGIPVLASRNCGDVVRDGKDGRILANVSAESIADMIRWFSQNTDGLQNMRKAAMARVNDFRGDRIISELDTVFAELAE